MSGALRPGARVLVVGGGIGGLTTGIALRKAGFEPLVLERHREPAEVGAGISLWPNAVHPLGALGLGDAVREVALEATGGALRRADGRVLARLPGPRISERFGAPVLFAHRADLVDLLRAALGADALRDATPIVDVAQDEEHATVTTAAGETLRGDVLVGADGVRSLVRERLWGDAPAAPSGAVAWRAVVPAGDELRELEGESWGRGVLFGAVPLRDDRIYWFAAAPGEEEHRADAAAERAALLARLAGWAPAAGSIVTRTAPERIIRTPLLERPVADPLASGRTFLLGDAAHPMLPNLGQGGCQAIEDAVELAAALAGEGGLPAAMRRYEAVRGRRVRMVVTRSRRAGRAGLVSSPGVAALRNAVVRATPEFATVRGIAPVVGHRAGAPPA